MKTKRLSLMWMVPFMAVVIYAGSQSAALADVGDNTEINRRDSLPGELTADNQAQTPQDIQIAQDIRKGIVDDQSLSTYAHNIKVIAKDGLVTLKGPVRSSEERTKVEDIASKVVGFGNIQSEINVVSE